MKNGEKLLWQILKVNAGGMAICLSKPGGWILPGRHVALAFWNVLARWI